MDTIYFSTDYPTLVAKELARFNISGSILFDSADTNVMEFFVKSLLQAIGANDNIFNVTEVVQNYYIFQSASTSIKPVHIINCQNIKNVNELQEYGFSEYSNSTNSLIIMLHAVQLEKFIKPLLKIKTDTAEKFECTITALGKKRGLNIHRLDVDNPKNATKIVIANTTGSRCVNFRIYATLDLDDKSNEQVPFIFHKLINSIFPIGNFESPFSSHLLFYINFINDCRSLKVLIFCNDGTISLPHWDYTTKGLMNDSLSCEQILYELLKRNEENLYNDIESVCVLNFIRRYEREHCN